MHTSALSSLMTPSCSIDFLLNPTWRLTRVADGGAVGGGGEVSACTSGATAVRGRT